MTGLPFAEIKAAALAHAEQLLFEWFPGGKIVGHEFKIGSIRGEPGQSLSVNLTTGKWADFAGHEAGKDLIDLRAAMCHRGDVGAAARELAEKLGIYLNGYAGAEHDKAASGFKPETKTEKTKEDWQPMVPPPPDAPRPQESLFRGFDTLFEYTNTKDQVTHYVGRIDARGTEKKVFVPVTYGVLDGVAGWVKRRPGNPLPLYGLNRLTAFPDAPVLLCEGEKAADAAQRMFRNYACLSWCGGTGSVDYADLAPLQGRAVTIWPDADEAGLTAAHKLVKRLPGVRMVRVDDLPYKFDAADLDVDDPDEWFAQRLVRPTTSNDDGPLPHQPDRNPPPPSGEEDYGDSDHYQNGHDKGAEQGKTTEDAHAPTGLPLVWFDDLQANLDAADFVEGILIAGAMSVIYGESNCGKTFFMTDLAMHVAMGRPWRGREVDAGGVIYCALEGAHGIGNRVAAFRSHYAIDTPNLPFAVIPISINLLNPDADTEPLITAIKSAAAKVGIPISLVVIDTLSRALAGGNENAPDDMGALVTNTDRVRQTTGAHVAYIHHSGKDAAKGARGHSLLRAATDTEIEVSRVSKDSPSFAKVTKQREMEIEGEFTFELQVVELGQNRRGKPVTSCVVAATSDAPSGSEPPARLGKNSKIGADMLRRALSSFGKELSGSTGYPPNTMAVTVEQWRQAFYAGLPGEKPDTKRNTFRRVRDDLLAARVIASMNEFVWFVRAADE